MFGRFGSHDAGAHRDGAALPNAQSVQIILGLAIIVRRLSIKPSRHFGDVMPFSGDLGAFLHTTKCLIDGF